MKKLLAGFLVLLMFFICCFPFSVEAATTPETVSVSQVQTKIEKLKSFSKKWFTSDETKCELTSSESNNGYTWHQSCSNCNNGEVLANNTWVSNWIKSEYGVSSSELDRGNFPYQYFPKSSNPSASHFQNGSGSSCYGFASFAQWYIFSTKSTDKVTPTLVVSGVEYNYENLSKYAKPGDIIRTSSSDGSSSGHSMIFISCTSTGVTHIDCNGTVSGCRVDYNQNQSYTFSSKRKYMAITRASNSPYNSLDNVVDGSLYLCTDSEGHTIRDSASTSGDSLGTIPNNEYFVVTETTEDGKWGFLTYKTTVGWTRLYEDYTQYVGPYTCPVVTFNANGGSVSTPSKNVYINTPYGELPTPTRTGYKFNGWYTSASGGTKVTDTSNVTLTENQTLYAHWTANTYTITYNANGGSGAPANQTKTHDVTLTLSTTKPTKTGYTFVNWKATNGTTYAAGASYTANAGTTLTAQWKANTYTVTYNANGGSGAPANQTKTHDVTLTLSTTKPTRTGYTFKGWATSASGSVAYASGANYTSNSSVTLYAVWEKNLVDAQSIVLGEHKTTLEIGETDTVSFSITPANSDWETMYFLYYDSDIVELKWVNNQDAFEVTAKSAGETEIVIELENESGTKIKTSYVINVKLPENSSVMGDVNGDGEVTSLDVIILSRHIAGWTGYETLPYGK